MALGDPYASTAQLAARTGSPDDGTYTALLDTASRMVEKFAGRQFNRDEVATERRFKALDPERLPVGDFYTVTDLEVVVDGVAWTIDDEFEPRPVDGAVVMNDGWPFSDLMSIGRYWPVGRRRRTIEVTARWGWDIVPNGIEEATLRTARLLWDTSGSDSGRVKSETISGYSINYAIPELSTIRDVPPELLPAMPYRRRRFGVA
jgi:hypothetical protein